MAEGETNKMQNTKNHNQPITGDPFREGNLASPAGVSVEQDEDVSIAAKSQESTFSAISFIMQDSKEPPARSWGFLRTVSATRLSGWNAPRAIIFLEFRCRPEIDENELCSRIQKTFHPVGGDRVDTVLDAMPGKGSGVRD